MPRNGSGAPARRAQAALGTRAPMTIPERANQRWSLDFVSDSLADARRFRILTVVDDHTRECLGLVADTSLSGKRVARELDTIIALRGRPASIHAFMDQKMPTCIWPKSMCPQFHSSCMDDLPPSI